MKVISIPVPATCAAGANGSCSAGSANTATRAPLANEPVARPTAASVPSPSPNAGGQMTAMPPTKVSTQRPPRRPANTGQACPAMAAPTAVYTGTALRPRSRPPAPVRAPSATRPSSPAAVPLRRSPANTGAADRAPRRCLTFQKPGLRSPTERGSKPWARPTSTATGTEPSR
ncbi:hypothetical protein GCM10010182_45910 [Actinomadura cremea]|nr:hypothetical protein GCM10010182_45910 [Actinomadura cremea]